jgi:hypothetical protein
MRSRYTGLYSRNKLPSVPGICGVRHDGSASARAQVLDSLYVTGKSWSERMNSSIEKLSALLQRQQPASIRPINLANFAEHLLIWALEPLRLTAVGANSGGIAPEAVFLPVVVLECVAEQLDGDDGKY